MSRPDETFLLNLIKIVKEHPPAKASLMILKIFDGIYNDEPDLIDCKAGCSYCCYSRVEVSELEMKAVEAHIRHRWTGKQVDEAVTRAKAIHKKHQSLTKEERIFERDPCPLLDLETGLCGVYESRPLMCRSAFSTLADACARAHVSPNSAVPMLMGPKNYASEMVAAIRIGENKKDYEMNLVDGILKHFK